jgi:hypothetical protein
MIERVHEEKPQVLLRYVVPNIPKLLDEAKTDVKQRIEKLIKELYSFIGSPLLD